MVARITVTPGAAARRVEALLDELDAKGVVSRADVEGRADQGKGDPPPRPDTGR